MAVNPAIAMGVQPLQLADPLAQYGKFAAIQQAQNQNALAQYQLGAAQREEASQNALNEAYKAAYDPQTGAIDINKLRQSLSTGGFGSKLPGIEKSMAELQKERLTQKKLEGEVAAQPVALEAARARLVDDKLKQARGFLDTINPMDPNAPAQYIAWHEANHRDPVLGPLLTARGITVDQSRARIQQAIQQGPQAFAELLNQSKLGTEKFMEMNKPSTQVVDQGGQRQVIQLPGLGGAPTTVGTYADVPLPPAVEAQKGRLAQAGATTVLNRINAYAPASEKAQESYIAAVSEERKALRNAPDALKNIDAAKKLIPTASTFMGKGGEPLMAAASFLNNRLGMSISTQGVTDATVLRTRLFEGILDNLKKLDSQPSQEQQRVLAEALGNLGTDPAALGQILDRIGETVRDRVDRYNVDVDEAEKRGVKFPFKPQIKLPSSAAPAPAPIPTGPASAPATATPRPAAKQVLRTGKLNGRKVVEYTDGSVEYAD